MALYVFTVVPLTLTIFNFREPDAALYKLTVIEGIAKNIECKKRLP